MAAKGAKNKAVQQAEAVAVLEAVKGLDTTAVVEEVSNLQVSVQNTLAGVSATITSKLQQVEQIDKAIALKNQRLKELYGIEAEAVNLDDMKAQQAEAFEKWQKEHQARDIQWDEEAQETDKTRTREEEEWQYNFEQKKARAEADHKALVTNNMKQENLRKADLEKAWAAREAELKAKEVEFAELKKQVDSFETRVTAEAAKQVAIATNAQKKGYEHETALLQKDAAAAKALSEQQLAAKDTQITAMKAQIDDLKTQLTNALKDAKEIATSAVSAASGREVAAAMRQVVTDRDQGQGGKK